MTADVYITQETRDAILKGILQGSTMDSELQWSPSLNCTHTSVYTLSPTTTVSGLEEPWPIWGGKGAQMELMDSLVLTFSEVV